MIASDTNNRQWRLLSYPEGVPNEDNWILSSTELPVAAEGQMLVRAIYLDVAPYMRGRISAQKNYAGSVKLGDVMIGGAIGEVIQSNTPGYVPGDLIATDFAFGWQDYAVLTPSVVRRVDTALAPLPCWLDVLGLNGMSAYFALLETASMQPGDTQAHRE